MTSKAKVLFVCHTSIVSGAELVLLDIVGACRAPAAFLFEDGDLPRRLAAQGVVVDTYKSGDGPSLNSVKRSGSLLSSLPVARSLAGLTSDLVRRSKRVDVIYANSQKAFTLSALACAITRKPLIWHLHDILSPEHFGAGQRRVQIGLANRFASAVVVPSLAASDAFIAAGGRASLVRVVPNGLDIENDGRSRVELRKSFGLPEKVLGVFSRLAPWKGQHVLLEAMAQLPGVNLIVVGSPLFGETQYETRLHALAAKLGIADRVQFLGQRSDVGRLMRAVDIVVHPSVDPEPFGRTLVEAMLARTPVVASNAGAASEILSAGELGFLFPPGDPGALAQAVKSAIDASAAGDMQPRIEKAELRARQEFSVAKMQSKIASVIDDVVASSK